MASSAVLTTLRDVHAAAVDEHTVERLALGVEAQQIHDLLVLAVEIGEQVLAAFGRGVEHLDLRAAAHEAAAGHLRHERDELRRGVAHAVDLFELGLRRGKYAVERAETIQKRVRGGVRIAARRGVIQQHLQHLHI